MFWKIIERTVSLTYLLLAITIVTILLTNSSKIAVDNNATQLLEQFKQENAQVRSRNINYLETRINKLAETQDSYQVSTSNRLYLVEKRMERIEQQNKISPKIINTNNSNAVINIPSSLVSTEQK